MTDPSQQATATRQSRRTFVKAAGAVFAASTLPPSRSLPAQAPSGQRGQVYRTSGEKRHEASVLPPLRKGQGGAATESILLDPTQRLQPILGFGSALTDASCFLLNSMAPEARQSFLRDTYSPAAMNLNAGRTTIGASDYSRDVYSYDDTADDLTLQHFSITHDEAYILPMLREIRGIQPDLFLLSSPWSPPGWMKTYGSMLGGWMTNKYLAPYAIYMAKFLESYRAAGIPIQAVTSQNELETDQGGSMPATYWTPEVESDFIRDHLGPLLRQRKDPAEIWLLDHNYELWKRVRWQMRDPELRKYVAGVAWHGYVGTPDQMSRLHDTEQQLPFHWTEGGPDYTDPHYGTEWTRWGRIFTEATSNWCRTIITWNLMLDPQGRPNIGPFSCGGLVTLRDDGTLSYSGQYWALRHFSQHVRRGAVRIASHTDAPELQQVAFENHDGSRVLVVTNQGDEREMRVRLAGEETTITLDKHSVTTVVI